MQDDQDPRVALAAERTLLAWIRTSMALIGLGFMIARFGLFLRQIQAQSHGDSYPRPSHFSVGLGTALVLFGVFLSVASVTRYRSLLRDFRQGTLQAGKPSTLATLVSWGLALAGLAMAAYLIKTG